MDEDERQRKLDVGRAKKSSNIPKSQLLASFRQKRAKCDSAGATKKTQKRKGKDVSQNDCSAQDCHLEPVLLSVSDAQQNSRTVYEDLQKPRKSVVQQNQGQKAVSPLKEQSPSLVEELKEEDLIALTGQEQLKQLQQAVEKRNEIIGRLSSNLQEAQASRDQVQLEAQSLARQIQALQKQLQQTSVEFMRIKGQAGAEIPHIQQLQPQPGPQETVLNHMEVPSREPGSAGLGPWSSGLDSSNIDGNTKANALLCSLRTELKEEKERNQQLCAELAEERESQQCLLSLLEEEKRGREEERNDREAQLQDLKTQLSQAQSQCFEIQQHKEEKELLNREVQELRRRLLEEEEEERRLREEVANSALRLQSFEEEREKWEEEVRRLKEVQIELMVMDPSPLKEGDTGLGVVEKGDVGLKASKNKQNQARANCGCEEGTSIGEADLEGELVEDGLNGSMSGGADILMERYLTSALPAHSSLSLANESLEEHSLLDMSANCSFELNSEVLFDQSLVSISQNLYEGHNGLHSLSDPQYSVDSPGLPLADNSNPQFPLQCLNNSGCSSQDMSKMSEQHCEVLGLEKELLSQQCIELQEELAVRERESDLLREEVTKSAEDLEVARDRWAQVSEELREALWQLEEEKEKRRVQEEELEGERERRKNAEEEVNLNIHEQDNLKNKLSALLEQKNKEKEEAENSSPLSSTPPSVQSEKLLAGLREAQEEKATLLFQLKEQELLVSSLQEKKQAGDCVTAEDHTVFEKQLQALQANCDKVIFELEETKNRQQTTAALLDQSTMELDAALKELNNTHKQVETIQKEVERLGGELHRTEREKSDLESQLVDLKQNLINLEEAQAQGAREKEEHWKKEEAMDEQIKKMEQLLEEELEQFENLLKAKEDELAEEREKWEEEHQEKREELIGVTQLLEEQRREKEEVKALLEKQVTAFEEATERLRKTHQEEVAKLMEKHEEEVSELNSCLETELSKQKAFLEEKQKRQISLIKQVTEREYQRMVSELCAKQREELSELTTELSSELKENTVAGHQAELQQAQVYKRFFLPMCRSGVQTGVLIYVRMSQLEFTDPNLQQDAALSEVQAFRENGAQESAILQSHQQFELDQFREQSYKEQERLCELHQQAMEELKHQWETRLSQERASMEEKQIQALRLDWEKEAESSQAHLQMSLSETQGSLTDTQAELSNTQASLSKTQTALTDSQAALAQTQADLYELRAHLKELKASSERDIQRLEEELHQAWADRDAAARAAEELVSSHKAVLLEKEQHACHLQEKDQQLQQEVLRLQEEQAVLKRSSEQEVAHLWAQLESMRASRQELGELKEQLLARSSRVDDIERLKAEFSEQRREIREQNEAELESLRRYFEQRLRTAEEGHREEIALLQLRLVEGALEESVLKTGEVSFMSEGKDEEKNDEELDTLRWQLEERHELELSNLRSSMTLSYKEELLQARSDLTDRYYEDLQELKTRHALELEQLRARLSDSHVQDLTRIRLEAARQVEVEVEQRIWCHSEELRTRMTIIQTLENRLSALSKQHEAELQRNTQQLKWEFAEDLRVGLEEAQKQERESVTEELTLRSQAEAQRLREECQEEQEAHLSALEEDFERRLEEERTDLKRALQEEMDYFMSLQAYLDIDQTPQFLAVAPENQIELEMKRATRHRAAILLRQQGKARLYQAQDRFQKENAQLEQRLAQKDEFTLGELREKHQAELQCQRATLLKKHSQEIDTLCAKNKAQLDSLSANHREKLTAMAAELDSKHKAVLVALEATLDSKWKAELDSREAVLRETSQAQLEALEAELVSKHQEERDELERRMLGNMDTLEATYLKEVQTLRDEMVQLEERHHQEVNHQKVEHRHEMEHQRIEQLSVREELRKELAQVHMEKFSAMAAELSHAHQAELSAQKEALDAEHCKALETLKKQVLELEQQHSMAFQELSHTYTMEKEQLIEQHQLQMQELKSISARELEACRRECEEESSRQRLHFLEEVELLKVQSEERLQDRINQLKAEFEDQKEAELEVLRRSFTSERELKECSYTEKMSQLTAQLQQLDAVVAQLRAEVGCLQGELEGKRAEMETLDTLLQRRERESQEGGNLLKMLTEDLQTAKQERLELHQANEKLRKVLLEVIHSTVTTEELIGQGINVRAKISEQATNQNSSSVNRDTLESGVSFGYVSTDLEPSQLLSESLVMSNTHIHPVEEETALSACSRLRHTVHILLELLNQANAQLEQTHGVHLSLEERFSQGREDSAQLLVQHKLLLEQLDQEAGKKSQLQLELHKAEGLLEGYATEKATMEEALQQKEAQEERLVEELEGLKVHLHQMEGLRAELESIQLQHQVLSEEHTILLRQKDHLSAGLGKREKGLLAEAERLAGERLDLQRQAEKDHSTLSKRLRALETEMDEQETKGLEREQQHKTHTDDLNQHIQALEKQLKNNRQFIDEQAVEREHERDEFQQEIRRLEALLRQTARGQASGDNNGEQIEDLVLQVESLQAVIKDRTEDHASLLLANQQAQRDIAERNEEIDKLAGRIRELEQALLSSAESNRSVSQLEQELHRMKLREQELTQDKQALEQQQLSNRLQISALQSKLDETKHCYHDNTPDPTQQLRDALDTAQQNLQTKEQEVEVLVSELEQVQRDLGIKEAELKHLTLQLEMLTDHNAAQVNQLQEEIAQLKENVSTLTILQEEQEGRKNEEGGEQSLSSALLEEKNQEIDHLNQEIQRLEQQLENTGDNSVSALEAELEDLRSQVEHLHCDITRLRQDKQEEEERLHEVISTLQAELATLGPTLHEVSDSQDGDSVNPSPSRSPEPHHCPIRGAGRKGAPDSLKQELRLTHSASSHSLHARLEAVQSQLETAEAEKEALERLLLTQEEEYRGNGEALGKRLIEEREKADALQGLLVLKEAELTEVRAHAERLEEKEEHWKVLEEERDCWQAQFSEMNTLCGEKAQLCTLVTELKRQEQDRVQEMEMLKIREEEMKREMDVVKENNLMHERQVQELRAKVGTLEKLVAEGRAEVITLETVKGELFAEREALRKREGQLQEEIERLRLEVASQRAFIQELSLQLMESKAKQEKAEKEVMTHAEVTLAKTDAALRQREAELARLRAEHQALRGELATVKEGLSTSTERAEKLLEEGQTKDRALADLETNNQRLKAELRGLQEDLAVQEEELAYQQRELQNLRQRCQQQDTPAHNQGYTQKDISHRAFTDSLCVSRDEASLSSPEVFRRLECSEDRIQEGLQTSLLQGSRLSELSVSNSPGLDLPQTKTFPRVGMEPPHSRTITPESASQSTHSQGSVSVSDNISMLDSDTDKVRDLESLDISVPPSPLGSTSSLSAPEWASDGYGSNVSSEVGMRLRVELEQTERLDAQFVEYLHRRGMNPTVNTDSAAGSMSYSDDLLSPELHMLLKKVYQESCRILTLSQRRATSSSQYQLSDTKLLSLDQTLHYSNGRDSPLDLMDKSPSTPPMSWQQEKRALQETVIALRELLCRMAQRDTRTDCRDDGSMHTAQAQTDGQVEVQLRAELEENRTQLNAAHNTQQEHKNKIQSLSLAVKEGEETLMKEQAKTQELQQQLEQERILTLRREKEEEEKLEALRGSLEQRGSEIVALKGQLEQERVACSNLRRELQIEQSRSMLLEKRLDEALENECQRSTRQQDLHLQERSHLERLLSEAESRLANTHSQLAEAHRKLEEEREQLSSQLNELSRRQEADAARDRKFISDMRSQLEQERRQGEDLAAMTDRLRAELLQSQRRGEEEDRRRGEESQREQEATACLRVTVETMKEQKQEASCALEAERDRFRRQGAELAALNERLQLLKDKGREREEQWERERRKEMQEQMERERRQERTNNKMCELELLRQQDQQRLRELQQTLAELQREGRKMVSQRLSGPTAAHQLQATQLNSTPHNQQSLSPSSRGLAERLLKENSELTERVTRLSQERVNLKHTLTCLERQLRNSENELAKVTTETENRPINDATINHGKLQRLYGRYLRAESFRKSLVYQKRYLLLLLGGFQECEQATLCLIAHMGARPSPSLTSQHRPLTRFRAAVRAVIAISRMRFLNRKWQKAIKKLSASGTVNGHASGFRMEVLRQQQPRINSESSSPTKDGMVQTLVPPIKSPFRLHNRSMSSSPTASGHGGGTPQDPEQSLMEYIHHLEKVQQRLVGTKSGSFCASPLKDD
ncbi:pericentrin [Lampris incognitus]|uniref:pericentrin n=1 Tax=Lampris incognitus TaxID=2546036 RepID=UPI0024B49A39|nr:pericentrin [Lampris incognitus]